MATPVLVVPAGTTTPNGVIAVATAISALAIRDTIAHDATTDTPGTNTFLVDVRTFAATRFLAITSTLNQNVTLTYEYSTDGSTVQTIGQSVTIPSSPKLIIDLNSISSLATLFPYVAVQVQCATAPTSGSISVSVIAANIGSGSSSGTTISQVQGIDSTAVLRTLSTTTAGALNTSTTLQTGTAMAGSMQTYREYLSRGQGGGVTAKTLYGWIALSSSAGAANTTATGSTPPQYVGPFTTANGWTGTILFFDQNNLAYTTPSTGKNFYVSSLEASVDVGTSGALQSAYLLWPNSVSSTAPANIYYQCLVTSNGLYRDLPQPIVFPSGGTLRILAQNPQGITPATNSKLYVTLIGWEE